ncbi:MAG: hypothetical protein HYY06_04520 [Deltaproteobacteria bacterium]|nr:hypothetical protein [Deltaproteobacteria bacterium]
MRTPAIVAATLLSRLLAGCDCGDGSKVADGGRPDAGDTPDAADAAPDAGATPDSGEPDAGTPFCLDRIPSDDPLDPDCPNPEPAEPDSLDEALALAGIDRCSAVFTPQEWGYFDNPDLRYLLEDEFRLPIYPIVHDAPLRAPTWARAMSTRMDEDAASDAPVAAAIHLAADRLGRPVETCEVLPASATLAEALGALGAEGDLEADLASVPADLASALVPIVDAIRQAAAARDEAIAAYEGDPAWLYEAIIAPWAHPASSVVDLADEATRRFIGTDMDYPQLYGAAASLALTIERANLARFAGLRGLDVDVETPLGRVLLRDASDHVHRPAADRDPVMLLLDTGGDDLYLVPAGATTRVDAPVAVAIDLGGADEYGYDESPDPNDLGRLPSDEWGRFVASDCWPACCEGCTCWGPVSASMTERQGAARLGVGLLFDLGDEPDRYASLRFSQGFGALGVGVLYDGGGDDAYAAEVAAQGMGLYGIGLLIDQAGNDTHRSYQTSQGTGWILGFGGLYDRSGNDEYVCDLGDPELGGDPMYFSVHIPCVLNTSFCQGSGVGTWYGISGGLGVLRDAAGDDRYETSDFGQGAGYGFGIGVLDDEEGADTYDALWAAQGMGVHMGLGTFRDGAGDDRYGTVVPPVMATGGLGRDFGAGFFIDIGGDDTYVAATSEFGASSCNGFAFFVEAGGSDSYTTPAEEPFAFAFTKIGDDCRPIGRCGIKTLAVFLDIDGQDEYVIAGEEEPRDDTSWSADADPDGEACGNHSGGLDTTMGRIELP